jgi:hypothetical protein
MRLSPPAAPDRYDEISKPEVFGATRDLPKAKADGGGLELRTVVTFSGMPYVNFIVPVHCGSDPGRVAVSATWAEEGTDPGKPLTTDVSAYQTY